MNIKIKKGLEIKIKIQNRFYFKSYGICKIITTGFLIGAILDFILPCTFGFITKLLKNYGNEIYIIRYNKPKNKIISKIINYIL